MDIQDLSLNDGEEEPPVLPTLPDSVWAIIVQIIFEPLLDLRWALEQIVNLSFVNSSLNRACKIVTLKLDARRSLDRAIAALSKLPIAVEYLDLDDFYNREYVLRSETFRKYSALTLKHVAAAVRCTDTLQSFPNLHTVILHGLESFPTLYSSVLSNLGGKLRHLELVSYEHTTITDEVPLGVLKNLETLKIRPSINRNSYALHKNGVFPLKLKKLYLDGLFRRVTAAGYSPHPCFSLTLILTAAEEITIEARFATLNWGQDGVEGISWIVNELLNAPKTFKRLDLNLLDENGIGIVRTTNPLNIDSYPAEAIYGALVELYGHEYESKCKQFYYIYEYDNEDFTSIFDVHRFTFGRPRHILLPSSFFEYPDALPEPES